MRTIVVMLLLMAEVQPVMSDPVPSSWNTPCRKLAGWPYALIYPRSLKDAIRPDIGVFVFSESFTKLAAAKLILQSGDSSSEESDIEVIATPAKDGSNPSVFRALLPKLDPDRKYFVRVVAPLDGPCPGNYEGSFGTFRTTGSK